MEFPGYNLLVGANLPNAGTMFVSLEAFEHRKDPHKSAQAIMDQLYARYAELRDARVLVLPPPPVRGLGSIAGFKMMVQDRTDAGLDALAGTSFKMMVDGSQTPGLAQVFTTFTTARAAALRGRGSRQGQEHERCPERCERHAANLSWLALRE